MTEDMRRQIVLRELNQGALAGLDSNPMISEYAAGLILTALNDYDNHQRTKLQDREGYWGNDPTKWYAMSCYDCGEEAQFSRATARFHWAKKHKETTGHHVSLSDLLRSTGETASE